MDPSEPAIQRYRVALATAAAQAGPASFQITGLTLTPGTVMACAHPTTPAADLFMDSLADALGPDAWHELPDGRRDIWYLNLLHFTTDICDPTRLVDWVNARRRQPISTVTIQTAELVRFRHSPDQPRPFMRPVLLASSHLDRAGESALVPEPGRS